MTLFHGSVILACVLALSWFSDFALLHQGKKMYEHNALGYWSVWPYV